MKILYVFFSTHILPFYLLYVFTTKVFDKSEATH